MISPRAMPRRPSLSPRGGRLSPLEDASGPEPPEAEGEEDEESLPELMVKRLEGGRKVNPGQEEAENADKIHQADEEQAGR